jgi:hypothetical protein
MCFLVYFVFITFISPFYLYFILIFPRTGAVSSAFSSLDLPSHTTLKFRQPGQATSGEVQRKDLRAELEQKEQQEVAKSAKLPIKNIEGCCVVSV